MNDRVRPCNLKPQQRDLTPVLHRPVELAAHSGHSSCARVCPLLEVVSTGRRNTGGTAGNKYRGRLAKRPPNRFRRLPSQPAIPQHHILCRPHATTKSLTYRPTLSIFSLNDKVLRRPVELADQSGRRSILARDDLSANDPQQTSRRRATRRFTGFDQ